MTTWFRGDLHVHSQLSNGADLTPAQIVGEARAAGLDFLAVTEHNLDTDFDAILDLWTPHASGLLILPGCESITDSGHSVTAGPGPAPLRIAAHPRAPYPTGTFTEPFETVDAVEVWNGAWTSDAPWQADNEAALADWHSALIADIPAGNWRPAVGDSDAHLADQLGTPHNVVPAAELTADAVLAAIRAGSGWIAESAAVHLRFAVGPDAMVTVEVDGVPAGYVTLHTERGEVHRSVLPEPIRWSVGDALFVRVEVRHPDGRMAALSNPLITRL